jgi:homospermidine synthase
MVNLFTKHAMMIIARKELGAKVETPQDQAGWAALAQRLEIDLVQISERDTQQSSIKRQYGEFTSSWCPSAMIDESR